MFTRLCAIVVAIGCVVVAHEGTAVRQIDWADMAPLHPRLEAAGITKSTFASYVARIRESNARRVREGDLDHLVFYLLQSARFTSSPPIEPALSAQSLVESLDAAGREAFFKNPASAASFVAEPVRSRVDALLRALGSPDSEPRLAYFRALVDVAFPDARSRATAILHEYLRVMKFVYEKEFIAQRTPQSHDAVVQLYRQRGLSTDTAVEAGFLVYQGLGVLRGLDPSRRIRRVLIVGPGLDLAPRTGLLEVGAPESYQPWAVMDALLTLGLSREDDLEVVAADINPRVVEHLRSARDRPLTLTIASELQQSDTVVLSDEFREYFTTFGLAIGGSTRRRGPNLTERGRLQKIVHVRTEVARALDAERLDIVTQRFDRPAFDLIVATNVLPYFDDVALMLALSNVAAMLAADGVLLHNEARPAMQDITVALGLPLEQSRQAVVASVRGSAVPLVDAVWLHRRRDRASR